MLGTVVVNEVTTYYVFTSVNSVLNTLKVFHLLQQGYMIGPDNVTI